MALGTEKETLRSIGNWELCERLAASGVGTVYKARHRVNGDLAAVKVLPPFQAGKEQSYQRFARECRILSALHDPHIVRAIDFGIEGCEPYLVMEYVEGERLSDRVGRVGALPEAEAVRLIGQLAGALSRMHARKLVHRNVQPDTILITPDGEAKLTDLCLIKDVESGEALTRDGAFLGTPHFMAPEQFRNAAKANRRSDVYALAATLYFAVTAEPPFGGCNLIEMCARKMRNELVPPQTRVTALSAAADRAICRALNAEPMNRPASCDELIAALHQAADAPTVRQPASVPDVAMADVASSGEFAVEHLDTPAPAAPATPARPDEPSDGDRSGWLWFVVLTTLTAFVAGLYFVWRF